VDRKINNISPRKWLDIKRFWQKKLEKDGRCVESPDNGEFTKPVAGKIVKTFDSLGQDYRVSFEIKVTGRSSGYTNILFGTSASAKKLGKASHDDLLNPHGDIPHDSEYPEINRHPGIWIKPNSADLEICTEFVKWENTSGRPLERCWSSHNVEFWKELKINEWYTINLSQFCWFDEDYYYDYGYDYYDYYDYRRKRDTDERFWGPESGCDTRIEINGPDINFSFSHTLGNREDAFQEHKDVKIYGSIPNSKFPPAKVQIRNFEMVDEGTNV